MTKFPEAENRRFHNMFVCRICKSRVKAPNMKVMQGKVSCRKCGSSRLRTVRKK